MINPQKEKVDRKGMSMYISIGRCLSRGEWYHKQINPADSETINAIPLVYLLKYMMLPDLPTLRSMYNIQIIALQPPHWSNPNSTPDPNPDPTEYSTIDSSSHYYPKTHP